MKMNTSVRYGLMAAAYVAQNCDEGCVQAKDIAREYNIPLAYGQVIMGQLCMVDVLRSKRGPHGGYTLARPAKEISLLEIWEAIDGPLDSNLEMAEITRNAPFSIKMEKVWQQATDKGKAVLAKAKLSNMIQ